MTKIKRLLELVLTFLITTCYCSLWQLIEIAIDGHTTNRLVDNIIMIMLIPIFYIASKWIVNNKKRSLVFMEEIKNKKELADILNAEYNECLTEDMPDEIFKEVMEEHGYEYNRPSDADILIDHLLVLAESDYICNQMADVMEGREQWCEVHCKYNCPQKECYYKWIELKRKELNNYG